MNISVIGTGYVGLVTGTCLSESGNNVMCVDIDEKKVKNMQAGQVPIYEPDLDTLFNRNIKQNRLHFTTNLEEAVKAASIVFLALPTPQSENGAADISRVLLVAEQIGKILNNYKVIVDKSTVPIGTAELVRQKIAANAKSNFDVVANPEFLREGYAVTDFMKPSRIIIGSSSNKAKELMGELYAPFVRQGNPIIYMDEPSAEMTKYAANAFLATKISFMNEIANLCEKTNANVDMVRLGIGTDDRIGKRFLFAGIGYGGSCFPKDVKALSSTAQQSQYDFKIVDAVMQVNEKQWELFTDKILAHFGTNAIKNKKIALWGLSFKPETDDIREAPSLKIINYLLKKGVEITAFDPEATDNVKQEIGNAIAYAEDHIKALKNADALIICTEWAVFRNPDFDLIKKYMKSPVIFDGRNLFEPNKMKENGITYFSIGRQSVK